MATSAEKDRKMNQSVIAKIGHNQANSPVDRAGALKAEIAALEAQLKPLEAEIKALGAGTHPGDLFDANVAEVAPSESYDTASMEEKLRDLGVDDRWFSRHIKIKAGHLRLSIKARK